MREQNWGAMGTRLEPSKVTEFGAKMINLNQSAVAGPAPLHLPGLCPAGVRKIVSCRAGKVFVTCFPGQRSMPSTPGSCSF